jgi:V8-like Glu-specific endopeptidase
LSTLQLCPTSVRGDILRPCISGADLAAGKQQALGAGEIVRKASVGRELDGELEIIGTDDRVAVLNTLAAPFRFICALDLYSPDPDDPANLIRFRGSGTLISPRHVLTAGHRLLTFVKGSAGTRKRAKVSAIRVAPGRRRRL